VIESLRRFDRWIQHGSRATTLLSILVLGYFSLWCSVSFMRHYFFHSSYDLAIMDQVVWNTSQGRLFGRSIEVSNDLADHVRPFLAVLGIAYTFVASPYVLLTLQCLALAVSALPLYRLATRRLSSPFIGLAAAFCLLAYPPLGLINRYDFHVEVLSIPLLIWAYERIDEGDLKTASLIMALTLLCKENLGLTIAALGIASGLLYRRWRFGLGWAVAGMAYSLTALFAVIPAFRGVPSDTLKRYYWLGGTPFEMLWSAVSHPDLVLHRLFAAGHALTLLQLIAPLALLPLLGFFALLPAAPALLYNFLAEWSSQSTIYTHYMIPIIPFVAIAAVMGLHRLGGGSRQLGLHDGASAGLVRMNRSVALGAMMMIMATLASWVYENPVTGNALVTVTGNAIVLFGDAGHVVPKAAKKTVPVIWPNDGAIRDGLRSVSEDEGVLTTSNYAPHLSHRTWIEMIPRSPVSALRPEAQAIFLNLKDQRWWNCQDYLGTLTTAERLDFGVSFNRDSVLVVERHRGDRGKLRDLVLDWPGCE
jgi:uncharacterized membrane protein